MVSFTPPPQIRRWMVFVDGENLTIEAQKIANANGVALSKGAFYIPDVFYWFPHLDPKRKGPFSNIQLLLESAERASYYTSACGSDESLREAREIIWNRGFHPEVFHKRKGQKSKGVDIALTKDLLVHSFARNLDVVILIAGDADYVPVIQEIRRCGRIVCVAFFDGPSLSVELKLAADFFFDLTSEAPHN